MAGALRDIRDVRDVNFVVNRNNNAFRVYQVRVDPFNELSDTKFKKKYRFTKDSAERLIDLLRADLQHEDGRGLGVSVALQVLTALRFFARGNLQDDNGDIHGLSQPTVSRIVCAVATALASRADQFIKFPTSPRQVREAAAAFHAIRQFPNVIGAIDCTHIPIQNPGGADAQTYINRKGYSSLNVQMICSAEGRILHVVARWRGSVHDSRIWSTCLLSRRFEQGLQSGILVGDNGYACTRNMLTPLLNPANASERRYNVSHKATRCVIERTFGMMKRRFQCLSRKMALKLNTIKTVIVAVAVLHNLAINFGDDFDDEDDNGNVDDVPPPPAAAVNIRGNVYRQQFIQQYFQRRP